jgi:hypothetical protein
MGYLATLFQVTEQEVRVCCSHLDDFLLVFSDPVTASWVLHVPVPQAIEFNLCFYHWCRQARARFSPLCYKVLMAIDNALVHT